MKRGARGAVVLAMMIGCTREAPPQAPPEPPTAAPQAARAPAPEPTPEPATAPAPARPKLELTRAELQSLLDTWLDAQNDGDFAAYEQLYAAEMHGIKRAGSRESRFDRAQWLADRARMFRNRKKMEVGIRDVVFSGQGGSARIDFVQVFRQGSFMDSGPKRLTVVERQGAARIVREEMLQSKLIVPASTFDDSVYLLSNTGDASWVVLVERADPAWGKGSFEAATDALGTSYTQKVDVAAVPRAQQWLDTTLRTYDRNGQSCTSAISELRLMLLVDVYGVDEEAPELQALLATTDSASAHARFVMQLQPPMLVGKLARCSGVVATPEAKPPAAVHPGLPLDLGLEERARKAAMALPAYQANQLEWEKLWRDADNPQGEAPPWEQGTVSVFGTAGAPRFVSVLFSSDSCDAQLSAELFVLYRIDARGELEAIAVSPIGPLPSLLLDVNGDGLPEIYGGSDAGRGVLYGLGESGAYRLKLVPVHYGGCGC